MVVAQLIKPASTRLVAMKPLEELLTQSSFVCLLPLRQERCRVCMVSAWSEGDRASQYNRVMVIQVDPKEVHI